MKRLLQTPHNGKCRIYIDGLERDLSDVLMAGWFGVTRVSRASKNSGFGVARLPVEGIETMAGCNGHAWLNTSAKFSSGKRDRLQWARRLQRIQICCWVV